MYTNINTEFTRTAILFNLKSNKERYLKSRSALIEAYQQAVDKYQEDFKAYSLKVAKGELTSSDHEPPKPIVPKDMQGVYDSWIKYFEGTISESITLDFRMFEQLILDKWDWIEQHIWSLRNYTTTTSTSSSTSADLSAFVLDYESGSSDEWDE